MANGNFGGGTGSKTNPYLIEDYADLKVMVNNPTASYALKNDIDCSGHTDYVGVGTASAPFTGSFFGQGFTIRNLHITNGGSVSVSSGIISHSNGNNAGVFDITIENSSVTNTATTNNNTSYTGMLVGYSSNLNISNVHVVNCVVKGKENVGGVIGYFGFSNLKIISFIGTVDGGNFTGGIIGHGYFNSGSFSDVKSSGVVKGRGNYTGGVVGYLSGNQSSYRLVSECEIYGSNIICGIGFFYGYNTWTGSWLQPKCYDSYSLNRKYTCLNSKNEAYYVTQDESSANSSNKYLSSAVLHVGGGW